MVSHPQRAFAEFGKFSFFTVAILPNRNSRMGKEAGRAKWIRGMGQGKDSALGVPLAACLRPASRPCGSRYLWVGGVTPCRSFLLLQELSK